MTNDDKYQAFLASEKEWNDQKEKNDKITVVDYLIGGVVVTMISFTIVAFVNTFGVIL